FRPSPTAAVVGAAAVAAALALRWGGIAYHPKAESFALVFVAIVTEALPFVLLGAFVSAAIATYASDRIFERIASLPRSLQLPVAALGGFAFPVCECGSVPVARRLIARGVHPSAGVAFMVAAPIFNPVVLGSTWVAYRSWGLGVEMVAGRAVLGLLLAVVIGWAIGVDGSRILRPRACDQGACCGDHDRPAGRVPFVDHLTDDLFHIGRYLVLGAALAAAMQTFLPSRLIAEAASSPLVAALVLMGLAFVSSLCSEADAFVAVSFMPLPVGPQLAFLLFGPVLDLKLLFMYGASFSKGLVASIAMVAVPVTIAGSLWFQVIVG
ncbi:MAG: permease, partial [Actinomycetota bacterium]